MEKIALLFILFALVYSDAFCQKRKSFFSFIDSITNKKELIKNEHIKEVVKVDTILQKKNCSIIVYFQDEDTFSIHYEMTDFEYRKTFSNKLYPYSDNYKIYLRKNKDKILLKGIGLTNIVAWQCAFEYNGRWFRYIIFSKNPENGLGTGHLCYIFSPDLVTKSIWYKDLVIMSYGDINKDGNLDIVHIDNYLDDDKSDIYRLVVLTYKNNEWQAMKDFEEKDYYMYVELEPEANDYNFQVLYQHWFKE